MTESFMMVFHFAKVSSFADPIYIIQENEDLNKLAALTITDQEQDGPTW